MSILLRWRMKRKKHIAYVLGSVGFALVFVTFAFLASDTVIPTFYRRLQLQAKLLIADLNVGKLLVIGTALLLNRLIFGSTNGLPTQIAAPLNTSVDLPHSHNVTMPTPYSSGFVERLTTSNLATSQDLSTPIGLGGLFFAS